LFFCGRSCHRYLHSFPTRRSSDLMSALYKSNIGNPDLSWEGSQSSTVALEGRLFNRVNFTFEYFDKRSKDLLFDVNIPLSTGATDRKSTRLNSSHVKISYAVFCLK